MKRLSQNMDQLKKVVIEEEYRFDVMTLLLHLADLNVPSKEREVFLQWYKRLS